MGRTAQLRRIAASTTLVTIAWGLLLGVAYGQEPLFTSNQNQYYLHGLAQAGVGFLEQDWLANTRDPTPVFSWIVRLTAQAFDIRLSYLYFLGLFALYFAGLVGVARQVDRKLSSDRAWLFFLAGLFLTHSAALRVLMSRAMGGEWAYLFDGGVAGQRLMGSVLQPSCFGALLLLATHQFLGDRLYLACALCSVAALIHPTYLLSAAILVLSFSLALQRETKNLRRPILAGALALVMVAPIVLYLIRNFMPTAPDAQRILVHFRLPAHAVVAEWFDATVLVKVLMILVAIRLARGTRLCPILAIGFVVSVALTVGQMLTASDALALLFPWRMSTVLVPLSTAVLLAHLSGRVDDRLRNRGEGMSSIASRLALSAILVSVIAGLAWSVLQGSQQRAAPERGAMAFVAEQLAFGEVYFIPPKLQDFRLGTGAPIVADFKSIPYQRGEVIAWHDRVRLAQWFFQADAQEINCRLLEVAADKYGATHVLLGPEQRQAGCPGVVPLYDDGLYAVMALDRGTP